MSTKHTPGPWHLMDGGGFAFRIGDDADEDKANILCTRYEWQERAEEMLANGQLIAAAPDLLEACEALIYAWEHGYREDMPEHWLRAAVAKAKGIDMAEASEPPPDAPTDLLAAAQHEDAFGAFHLDGAQ